MVKSSAIPKCIPTVATWEAIGRQGVALASLVEQCSKLLVVTGAGVSTESGIPDYRGPGRPLYKPLQHGEFMKHESIRRRYWARSMIGFHQFLEKVQPNSAHKALAKLENLGRIDQLITQNVDRLHHKAGHRSVTELHGTIHEVECLSCGHHMSRADLQMLLMNDNEKWMNQYAIVSEVRPDGDVELPLDAYDEFIVPPCPVCGSKMLKPSVVFYGGLIPARVVERSLHLARSCDGMLIVGSTVSTFSAFRLVQEVAKRHGTIGIINYGETRADDLADFKIEASVGDVLSCLLGRFVHLT